MYGDMAMNEPQQAQDNLTPQESESRDMVRTFDQELRRRIDFSKKQAARHIEAARYWENEASTCQNFLAENQLAEKTKDEPNGMARDYKD